MNRAVARISKFVSRYLEKLEKGEFDLEENCWKNKDCAMGASGSDLSSFVKENHHLTRERSTVVTKAFSSNAIKIPPLEFVFKEKGN